MYRKLTCQVVGRHPGRAPWEFRGLHVGWALFLDRRRLRGFMRTDPCLLRAWGGLRLPPILKLFWCCLTTNVFQTLSSSPLTIQAWCSHYKSAVRKTRHHHGAAREPSGHPRPGSLRVETPLGRRSGWGQMVTPPPSLPPLARLTTKLPGSTFVVFAGPSPRLMGQRVSPLNIWSQLLSVPGLSCQRRVERSPDKLDSTSPCVK